MNNKRKSYFDKICEQKKIKLINNNNNHLHQYQYQDDQSKPRARIYLNYATEKMLAFASYDMSNFIIQNIDVLIELGDYYDYELQTLISEGKKDVITFMINNSKNLIYLKKINNQANQNSYNRIYI